MIKTQNRSAGERRSAMTRNERMFLLDKYSSLMDRYGVNSEQAANFVQVFADDQEFVDLAETARLVKKRD